MIDIGARIRHLRQINGLSQADLAERAGLTKGAISQIERNMTSPAVANLLEILSALSETPSSFFAEDDEEKDDEKKEDQKEDQKEEDEDEKDEEGDSDSEEDGEEEEIDEREQWAEDIDEDEIAVRLTEIGRAHV